MSNGQHVDDDNNMELDSDNVSLTETEYTQKQSSSSRKSSSKNSRPTRRKISMATRRRSRLLYLEKYGLNQPDWHSSQDDQAEDISMDNEGVDYYTEEPEEIIPVKTVIKRPVSIRNYVQNSKSQKRPKRFVKPQKSNSDYMSFPATEFKHVHNLMDEYTDKVYMEGYLFKRNDLNSNGSSCNIKKWSPWYVELCGPVLTLWDNSTSEKDEVYPQYINITDSTVQIEDRLTAETRTNLFSLNSAGANRFLLQATDSISLTKWILAIRLSCFECSHIQEIYTRAFITRSQFTSIINTNNKISKMEGFLQVRFPGSTGWKKFWASISNIKIERKLFSKKVISTTGHIMFYESKKAKYPVMTLQNVVQVYTVYPESPKLINMATLFKIEGSLYKNKSNNEQLVSASSSALLMTSNTNELVQWLICSFNAFRLYGRPDTLLDDTKNQLSLNFAQETYGTRLFLEPEQVFTVNPRNNLLANKKEFNNILLDKVLHGPPPSSVVEEQPLEEPSIKNNEKDRRSSSTRSNQVRNGLSHPTHLRTVTCASDMSESDEEMKNAPTETESDSDESLFKIGTRPNVIKSKIQSAPMSSFVKPITPNASKSSSEISDVSPSVPVNRDSFLPQITNLDNNFSNSILSETNHFTNQKYSNNEETNTSDSEEPIPQPTNRNNGKKKKSFYAAQHYGQRANSMIMTPQWPMYGSTGSIVAGDYQNNNNSQHWETSSVDPSMMMGNDNNNYFTSRESLHQPYYASSVTHNDMDQDDDDVPIASVDKLFTHNSLLDQSGQDRVSAKSIEKSARATGKPLVNVPSKQAAPRAGLLGVIQEKELENKSQDYQRNRAMMDEQMLMQERLMMEQRQQQLMMFQYMQQQYQSGMVPMMMPMMDPRMMPMMDPRLMSPPMMMDPRMMSLPMQSQQMTPIPSSSSGSNHSSGQYKQSKGRFQQQQQNDNQSIGGVSTSSGRVKAKRHMSSSNSITNSIHSSAAPSQSQRRSRNHS